MELSLGYCQSSITFGLIGFITTFLSYLAYLSYTPKVDKKSPMFTPDTVPLIGSWGFFARTWSFWKNAMTNSTTGNFSFWLGKIHVVGVSGEAARKGFLENRFLSFNEASPLVGHGPEFVPPLHRIYHPVSHNGRSWFQLRLLEMQKSEQLAKRLPGVARDARTTFEGMARNPSGVTNPSNACYNLVVKQGCRVVCTDEISDDPKSLKSLIGYLSLLMHTGSLYRHTLPWLPSIPHLKRHYGRHGLSSIVTPVVNKRMRGGSPRADDSLQLLIDTGDGKDMIIHFLIGTLFFATANAGYMAGALLNVVAHHTVWQEKIYSEIKAIAKSHSTKKEAPLVEQLDSMPLEAWESLSPSLDLCFKEAARFWVAFPMARRNLSSNSIPIPGSKEVIPGNGFVAYNCTEVHFDEDLYPNPSSFEPERFLPGREEFKKQAYGFLGWGGGRHPCLGMRWAKIQQNIIIGYALAMYKWTGCDANGQPNLQFDGKTDPDEPVPKLPQGLFCKHVPREKS